MSNRLPIRKPSALMSALLAALLALPATTPAAQNTDSQRAQRAQEQAREAQQQARETQHVLRERAQEQREIEREAMQKAREDLRASQAELSRVAARVAAATASLQRADIERAWEMRMVGRPVLGVVLQADPQQGARISAVSPGSAAADAGLQAGDRITAIDNKAIDGDTPEQRLDLARELIGALKEDRELQLRLQREGKTREVKLRPRPLPGFANFTGSPDIQAALAKRLELMASPRAAFAIGDTGPVLLCADGGQQCMDQAFSYSRAWRGVRLAALNPQLGRYFGSDRGVLVLSNDDEAEGIEAGDVLLRINGIEVDDPREAMRALRENQGQATSEVQLLRERKHRTLQLATPEMSLLPLLAPPAPPLPPSAPPPPPVREGASSTERPAPTATLAGSRFFVAPQAAPPPPAKGVLRGVLLD